jgi:TPR repeat protein
MSAEAVTTHPLESELMISLLKWLKDEATCPITHGIMHKPLIIHNETLRDSLSYEYVGGIDELIQRKKRNSRTDKYYFKYPLQDIKVYECDSHEQQIVKGWPVSINHNLKITIERLIETIQTEFEKYLDNYKAQEHPEYNAIKLLQDYKKEKEKCEGAAIFGDEKSMEKMMKESYFNEAKPKAFKWAEKLVKYYNNKEGKFYLALAYDTGECDYGEDKGKATKLYEELAESGKTKCMYKAGINYETGGNNLDINQEKAYQWFEKGHTKNHFDCSVKFANYCHDGTECEADKQKAGEIYENISNKMIENQNEHFKDHVRDACYNYGMILFMKRDIINGLRYIDCAQKNGCENAKKKMEDICRAGREGEEENEQENDEE